MEDQNITDDWTDEELEFLKELYPDAVITEEKRPL